MNDISENLSRLPEGWGWNLLKDITSILGDGLHGTPKYSSDGKYYFINGNNLSDGKIAIKAETKRVSSEEYARYKKTLNDRTILVSINGTLGNIAFYNSEKVILGKSACYFNIIESVDKRFIRYCFATQRFLNYANETATGSTIKNVSLKAMREFEIPLPRTLQEQNRIVAKLEELFTKLDVSVAELKKAKAQIKRYRQSVLKYAFEGKLTNENVKEGELPFEWQRKQISEISNVVRGGSPRPAGSPKFYDGTIPFLKVADLTKDNNVYVSTFEYTIKEAGLHKTRKIFPNTLLLTNSGATLGVPKISAIEATMNDGIAALLDLDERSKIYVYYFLLSKTDEFRKVNQGAAQPNLNTTIIKNVIIPFPPYNEQKQIVSEIDRHFSVADATEKIIDESLKQAERLRQSILKDAFSGKLVPQDPNDEPAEKLLERIKAERAKVNDNKSKITSTEILV
jgi:type I restriction enzyme S subunit